MRLRADTELIMPEEIDRIKEVYIERAKSAKIDYNPLLAQNYYILSSREKYLTKLLNKYFGSSLKDLKILDLGFGSGIDILTLIKLGTELKNISGTEIIEERFNRLKTIIPEANLILHNGFDLPFEDDSFDLINQSTVFSSVTDPGSRKQMASEMLRVLKKGGRIFSYDLKLPNPWNRNVVKIDQKEIFRLFPGQRINFYSLTLNPVIARRVSPYSIILCEIMEKLPFLCSHNYSVIEKS